MANTNPLSAIPEIGGDSDLLLDVFTHSSLRPTLPPGHTMNEEYGNTDRLAELGAMALDLVITNHFYLLRPMMSGRDMRVCVCSWALREKSVSLDWRSWPSVFLGEDDSWMRLHWIRTPSPRSIMLTFTSMLDPANSLHRQLVTWSTATANTWRNTL